MAANDMRLPKVYTSTGEPGGASPISVAVCSGPEVSSAPGWPGERDRLHTKDDSAATRTTRRSPAKHGLLVISSKRTRWSTHDPRQPSNEVASFEQVEADPAG